MRWSLIKARLPRRLDTGQHRRPSRATKRERGIRQRRHWEHQIHDAAGLARHVDYVHYNPVKHGWVSRPVDWPHSTLHGYIERGMASLDRGGNVGDVAGYGER